MEKQKNGAIDENEATSKAKISLSTDYHVQSRVEEGPELTALKPTKAESPKGSVNENIAVVVERILNKDSSM